MEKVNSPRKEAARARRIELERVKALERQAARKAWNASEEGREIVNAIQREFYATDAEYRAAVLESNKRWNHEHREYLNAYAREYRSANPEAVAEYCRKWRLNNPEAVKMLDARRAHRRRDAERKTRCDLKAREWKLILEQQDNRCKHCGREFSDDLKPTKDHIVPVSKGGGLTFDNTQALCLSCNTRKRDRLESELEYLAR